MTDWTAALEAEQCFLCEQIAELEHKIVRYAHALEACNECLEADSLRAMLHTAQEHCDLLNELLGQQTEEGALSLGSLLAQRINDVEREAACLASGWQRGRPIAPGYWELQNKREFLAEIERRYHAWEADRPYYPQVSNNGHAASATQQGAISPQALSGRGAYLHPWYIPVPHSNGIGGGNEHEAEDQLAALNAIQKTIYGVLRQQGFSEKHFKVTAQPDGSVFITGYAHTEAEREQIMALVVKVPDVREVLAGIQVVSEAYCPACTLLNQNGTS